LVPPNWLVFLFWFCPPLCEPQKFDLCSSIVKLLKGIPPPADLKTVALVERSFSLLFVQSPISVACPPPLSMRRAGIFSCFFIYFDMLGVGICRFSYFSFLTARATSVPLSHPPLDDPPPPPIPQNYRSQTFSFRVPRGLSIISARLLVSPRGFSLSTFGGFVAWRIFPPPMTFLFHVVHTLLSTHCWDL